ncbi:stalk domain-containing protein [Bacillus infantis]|uniref:stalk domain-containing protein n=1 Tax=Bacillus infantis TaxID=324767 RepID=UPI003CEE860C
MEKKLLLSTVLLVFLLANLFTPSGKADTADDAAKLYLKQHELIMKKNSAKAQLDGKTITADPFLIRNGRTYVPLKLIRDLDMGSVQWIPKNQAVRIELKEEYLNRKAEFRVGKPYMYEEDGTAWPEPAIPEPFNLNGRVYLSVKGLSVLGISASYQNGTLKWAWSEKRIDLLKPRIKAESSKISFTVLSEEGLYAPQYMTSTGLNGWSGSTGQVVEKGISMDGKTFNRVKFSIDLNPGINPVQVTAVSMGSKTLELLWEPEKDIQVPISDDKGLEITEPAKGYLTLSKGGTLTIQGKIKVNGKNLPVDEFTFYTSKYSNLDWKVINQEKAPVKNQQFSKKITFTEPGYYYINIYGPDIRYTTSWSHIIVKVN